MEIARTYKGISDGQPDVINWSWWDNVMTTPPGGRKYQLSNDLVLLQSNARTIFSDPQSTGIRPAFTLRIRDNNGKPAWAPNPPETTNDWNVWLPCLSTS